MATYSKAIAILLSTANTTINSAGGVFTNGQIIYEGAASKKSIIELAGSVATTTGGTFNVNLKIQKKSSFNATWGDMLTFAASGGGAGTGTFYPISFNEANKNILNDFGRIVEPVTPSTGGSGNQRIILYPDERLVVTGGSCTEGANFRFEYILEQNFST